MLFGIVFRLRHCVTAIKEEGYALLEGFLADVHSAKDQIARLTPIHLPRGDPVRRIVVSSRYIPRRQTLSPTSDAYVTSA